MIPPNITTSQVRRRRRIPNTPPEPETGIRVYCPRCGEVQRSYGYWRALHGNEVGRHYREVVAPDPSRSDSYAGEFLSRMLCPGGTVDLVADRAP